jgi:hypothetical protein
MCCCLGFVRPALVVQMNDVQGATSTTGTRTLRLLKTAIELMNKQVKQH